jgi:uncharacterized membrane protein YfcA
MTDLSSYYVLIACTFLIAGTIKGTIGIGLPTASIGILSQVIDPRIAILLTVIPMVVANIWQVYRARYIVQTFKRYIGFAVPLVVILGTTVMLTEKASNTFILTVLGIVVISFSVLKLLNVTPGIPDRYNKPAQITLGSVAGLLGGITAIWAPPMMVYLLSRNLDKDEFVRATGMLVLLGSIPLFLGFLVQGQINGEIAIVSTLLVIPTIAGFAIGERLRKLINSEHATIIVLIMFLVMGLNLLRRAFL